MVPLRVPIHPTVVTFQPSCRAALRIAALISSTPPSPTASSSSRFTWYEPPYPPASSGQLRRSSGTRASAMAMQRGSFVYEAIRGA
jgi:hypothetical protein